MFKATELYLIQDTSPEHKNTWVFLNKRLKEVVQLHEILINSDIAGKGAKDTILSTFITVSPSISKYSYYLLCF